jgi:uncharacterized cysteine cluster protein YcgN (CxxCxxCC family)
MIIYHCGAAQARGRLAETVDNQPFWRTKTLDELTPQEWESLCDGCGRCCLVKLEDEDTGEVHLTRLACKLLDHGSCRCKDYANRHTAVHDCVAIDAEKVRQIDWLPKSCGYRRVAEGRDLAWWHPLVSGDPNTVHEAGISVRGWAQSEGRIKVSSYHRYIIKDFEDE